MSTDYSCIKVDRSATYHVLNGSELYENRFHTVLKFHPPALAAAYDITGAFHINTHGHPVYQHRYKSTFGFYCHRAAVEDLNGRCFHILPDGSLAYEQRYAWCGNFQEDKCVVRDFDGMFFHINLDGTPVYNKRYIYVGDYKDDFAVVKRTDGKSTHIDEHGKNLHGLWYDELDVFHKGYARCRDQGGWFHVDINGHPAYLNRYLLVEPFYNNVAYALTHDNAQVLINEDGCILHYIHQPKPQLVNQVSGHMTQYWNSFALISFLQLDITNLMPANLSLLSQRTSIPAHNLKKLLKVIVDLSYITLHGDMVSLTTVGQELKRFAFLQDAADIWLEMAQKWIHSNELLSSVTNSFPDFKSQELSPSQADKYGRALLGYAEHEVSQIAQITQYLNKKHKKILIVGRQGIAWASAFYSADPSLEHVVVYIDRWINEPTYDHNYPFSIRCLEDLAKWPQDSFDAIYFVKILMHYDNEKTEAILHEAKCHLHATGQINVVEPVIGCNGLLSGLDLNMLFECGGQLRTTAEWIHLAGCLGLLLCKTEPMPNNTLLGFSILQHEQING